MKDETLQQAKRYENQIKDLENKLIDLKPDRKMNAPSSGDYLRVKFSDEKYENHIITLFLSAQELEYIRQQRINYLRGEIHILKIKLARL